MGPDSMTLIFWMLSFKPAFSLPSFTFIKRLFGYCSPSALRVVSSAYLRLLIFLPAILIPACASSSLAFLMMYSSYKLNKQGDNIQPWHSPPNLEPVCCSMSSYNYCFLTCIQVSQEASKVVWCSCLFKSFPQFVVIHTVKGFSVVNEGEVDIFLEFSLFLWFDGCWEFDLCFFCLFKSSLNFWKFSVHILLKPSLENFECYFVASMWDQCSCVVVWIFFGIAFLWDWNENTFSSPVSFSNLLSVWNLLAYWVQHFHSIIFKDTIHTCTKYCVLLDYAITYVN